jgi:hypothetical protein
MKSPFYFIVKPKDGKRYDDERNGLIISTSKEDYLASTREAIVIDTPIGYEGPIEVGDTVIVHHNTFKFYYDMKGREKSSWNYFRDDLFFIDDPYSYKRNGQDWKGIGRYVFVSPIENDKFGITTADAEKPLVGTIKYSNDQVSALGLKVGDTVIFEPESEYPFYIDGEKIYRMYTKNLTIKLNEQDNGLKEKDN